jgi:hypothetical protein
MVAKPWETYPQVPSSAQADNGAAQTGSASDSSKYCSLFSKDFALLADRCNFEYSAAQPCKPGTVTEIDTALRNFFNFLRGIQGYGNLHVNGVLGEAQNLTYEISKTISIVSGVLRTFTQRLRNFILQAVKELIQGAIQCLLTPLLEQIKDTVFGAVLDQLMCKFDEIMSNLSNLVSDFLFALIQLELINPALCAIEAFTNALLNNLANAIDNAIAPILDQISDLLGGAAQVVGSVFSVINQILAFEGLLCSEPKCPEDVKKFKTGPFGGPQPGQAEGFNQMISGPSSGLSNFNQSAEEWLNETFPVNSNIPGASNCYTGPYECGSPQIVLFGGGGSGASANAVVNGIGQIIGFNLLSGGSGYTSAPFVSIVDPAGCGGNAQAYAVMTPDGDQVESINLTSPGTGYSQNNTGGIPVVNSFIGSPNPVQVGNSITLNWNVSNFDTIDLSTGGNTISGYTNLTSAEGSASFVIDTTDVQFAAGATQTPKTYTLTATKQNQGSASQVVSQDYTFTVTTVGVASTSSTISVVSPPTIDSFTGSPGVGTALSPGQILTLSWQTTNANQVTLDPAPANNPTLPVDGSVSVTMPTNITSGILTSYTLTATNTNAASGQQSVTQVISYTVSPTAIAGIGTTTSVGLGATSATTAGVGTTATTGGGSNNAVSSIGQVQVLEGGIDYDPNDEVVIPGGNNGATFSLNTTQLGQIVSINVLTPGYGFTTVPQIQINSKNGVGAKFLTQLKFTPLDQFLAEEELQTLDPTKLVQVIDCVYK